MRRRLMCVVLVLLCGVAGATGGVVAAPRELRVCGDPDNLPFSNRRQQGFENKIAQLIAKELHATVRYTWMPQRRGFIRRTLKAGACDLVMGVPGNYDMVLATRPYYRSSYVFVYQKSRHLQLRSFDDPVLRDLRIGLHEAGEDGANQPPAHALARRGIVGNIVGYTMWDVDSVENPPGKVIDAVANGEVDAAVVWGPFGGYFALRQKVALDVIPVEADPGAPLLPFAYDIAMGVRPGEDAFKREIESVLDRRRLEIQHILQQFGVPLIGADTTSRQ
jgi:quinoprotein dehydrogenase-associated probable ABC transporter substrate-binding protein